MRKRIEKVDLTPERREQTRQRKDDVSRELGREVPVRKTYGDSDERKEFGGERKPYGEKREFTGERKPFNADERKPYGEKREFTGERKPYGERPERREFTGERKPFNSDKPYGERKEFSGERKPYGEKRDFNSGERKPYGEKREFTGERKPFNADKPYGERKEFTGERKPYGEKREFNSGERKPYGEKREFNSERPERREFTGERKPYGEKREFNSGERKPYGEKREFTGERKPFNSDKPYGERKEFGGERKPYGEKREFNSERPERREFTGERKPYGEKREFTGERKPFNSDKPYGERKEFGGERKPYGEKREFNSERPERREFTGERKPYGEKREFNSERPERREFNSGERKPYGEKREFTGERKPFNSDKPYGQKREFNSERPERREFNAGERKPYGEKREFTGERKPFNSDKPYGEKREFTGERKPYGERSAPASGERKPYGDKPQFSYGNDKRKPVSKRFDKGDFNKPRPSFGDKPSSEEKKSRGEGNDKPEKSYGSAKVNFGGKNLFKAHNPAEQSDKWTPTYKIGQYRDTAPKKVQKKMEASEKKNSSEIRLNRFIANAGICSRREADDIIKAGEITVNGEVVTEMGHQVQPGDVVKMGNKKLSREKMVYVLINKPKDFITTTEDPDDRKTVMDLVKNACEERIYPVGRLDRNTTGLLLLTNDGELADKLTHPSNEVEKLYQVELDKPLTAEHQEQILKGITLEDGEFKADEVGIVTPDNMVIGIKIHSGRNRIVRRLFESLGYDVLKLDRTTFAGLNKKDLPRGSWRFLTEKEVVKLKFFK
jgi:23S rRNA pseudouridine2605 synthase